MSIRVLIADDHPVLRTGLASLLESEPAIELVGEAEDGPECVEMAKQLNPDVIVLDINMPGGPGLDALQEIRELLPKAKVLILTMHDDVEYLKHVLANGGAGYILKHAAGDELITAVRVIAGGGVFIHPHHARILAQGNESPRKVTPRGVLVERFESLSKREVEVFKLLCMGHTNAEIAEMTSISVKTVETYKSRLTKKLGVSSRAALVRSALELGLIS